jgi:hypothetical protein
MVRDGLFSPAYTTNKQAEMLTSEGVSLSVLTS